MSIGDLSSKLKEKIDQDRQNLERIAQEEFETFQASLNASLQNALDTTATAINAQLQPWNQKISGQLQELENRNTQFRKTIARSCFQTAMLGLCLMLGITFGAWGLTKIMSIHISSLIEKIQELHEDKNRLKQTIVNLSNKTWGIRLQETKDGKFILLPKGTTIDTTWKIKKFEVIKLE